MAKSKPSVRRFLFRNEEALLLPARREEFVTLRDWISGIADELELTQSNRGRLLVVADEVFSNIASYAYPADRDAPEKETVRVEAEFNEANGCLTLTFSDTGIPFDPLDVAPPRLDAKAEDRQIGGLGIHLVCQFMDSVEYRREGDRNILVLKKDCRATG